MHHQNFFRLERDRTQFAFERFVIVMLGVDMCLQVVQMDERLDAAVTLVNLRSGRVGFAFLDLLQQLPVQGVLIDTVGSDDG